MAKTILGVDIGHDRLKLVLMNGTEIKKIALADMPDKLLQNGRIVSVETMGELIRETMRREHIRCNRAAVVLSGENVFVREVTMPQMTVKQLEYNLPFEFRDYISGELKEYVFDYAMLSDLNEPSDPTREDDEDGGKSMALTAVAAPAEQIEELKGALRKAGLKMAALAPGVCSFSALLEGQEKNGEYCVLDLGYSAIRLHVFHGTRHIVTRVLEQGMDVLDGAIAEAQNVDIHLAHTYLLTDHEHCQKSDVCMMAYNNIAVELMRALNFYRFSNPDSVLSGIWLCGGGANIAPLYETIENTLDIAVHPIGDLLTYGVGMDDACTAAQAVGITQY